MTTALAHTAEPPLVPMLLLGIAVSITLTVVALELTGGLPKRGEHRRELLAGVCVLFWPLPAVLIVVALLGRALSAAGRAAHR